MMNDYYIGIVANTNMERVLDFVAQNTDSIRYSLDGLSAVVEVKPTATADDLKLLNGWTKHTKESARALIRNNPEWEEEIL